MGALKQLVQRTVLGVKRLYRALLAQLIDRKESRFRRRLKKRDGEQCQNQRTSGMSPRSVICCNALSRALNEQLDLPNVLLADDLVKNSPELPLEEIMLEALELLGCDATPQYDTWNGTIGDLVRILEEATANSWKTIAPALAQGKWGNLAAGTLPPPPRPGG